jgi:hypothetical protein
MATEKLKSHRTKIQDNSGKNSQNWDQGLCGDKVDKKARNRFPRTDYPEVPKRCHQQDRLVYAVLAAYLKGGYSTHVCVFP